MGTFPWLGFIFWFGLFAWFAVASWMRYLREQERQKTLRVFAERGTPLDPAAMEKFFPGLTVEAHVRPSTEAVVRGLVIGGIVVLFVGIGLLIGAQLIAHIEPNALFAMSTGGVIVCCIGLGLVTASWVLRRMHEKDQARVTDAGDQVR